MTIVETGRARRESADLGEVLARSQGVTVRRGGGLGSTQRFSLAGLTDDQIRFFIDGIPLDLAGSGQLPQTRAAQHVEFAPTVKGVGE